jgi:hypothetical protein
MTTAILASQTERVHRVVTILNSFEKNTTKSIVGLGENTLQVREKYYWVPVLALSGNPYLWPDLPITFRLRSSSI